MLMHLLKIGLLLVAHCAFAGKNAQNDDYLCFITKQSGGYPSFTLAINRHTGKEHTFRETSSPLHCALCGPYLLVISNLFHAHLSLYDLRTNSLYKSMALTTSICDVATDGTCFYLLSEFNKTVSVLEGGLFETISIIPTLEIATSLHINNSKAYLIPKRGYTAATQVMCLKERKITKTIPIEIRTESGTETPSFYHSNNIGYLCLMLSNAIDVIDLGNDLIIERKEMGGYPNSIAFDQNLGYVPLKRKEDKTSHLIDGIAVIDLSTRKRISHIKTSFYVCTLKSIESIGYCVAREKLGGLSIYVIDLSKGVILKQCSAFLSEYVDLKLSDTHVYIDGEKKFTLYPTKAWVKKAIQNDKVFEYINSFNRDKRTKIDITIAPGELERLKLLKTAAALAQDEIYSYLEPEEILITLLKLAKVEKETPHGYLKSGEWGLRREMILATFIQLVWSIDPLNTSAEVRSYCIYTLFDMIDDPFINKTLHFNKTNSPGLISKALNKLFR